MKYEEEDIVIGTIDKIVGTSVFIKLPDGKEGVMSFSEVAPGRIRNIRDYINPGQKIVVKILRINSEGKHIDLSLRRVTQKEKKQALENEKKEKEILTLLKISTKDEEKAKVFFEKLKSCMPIAQFVIDFLQKSEKDFILNLKNCGLSEAESKELYSLMKDKIKEKKVVTKAAITLYSESENGIEKIKKIFSLENKNLGKFQINYLGAPKYLVSLEDKDYKEANKKMRLILEEIEKNAKSQGCLIEIKQEK